MTKTTALATPEQTADKYPIVSPGTAEEAIQIISENLGPEGAQLSALDRVTVPTAGGLAFTVTTERGPEPQTNLSGIIVLAQPQNAMWAASFDEAPNDPPVCFSADAITGNGDRFQTGSPSDQTCATCPFQQWGSGPDGKGKRCRNLRPLFLLQEGDYLPIVISVPRMSLKPLTAYLTLLARKGIPYYAAVTTIGLAQDKNDAGITYSKLTFAMADLIPKENRQAIRDYREVLRRSVAAARAPIEATPHPPTEGDATVFDEDEDANGPQA
jgi:hypothetical protein